MACVDRFSAGGIAAALLLAMGGTTAHAQDIAPPAPPPPPAPAAPGPELDPDSPMADLPDFGVDWPDLATPLPGEQADATDPEAIVVEGAAERRYRYALQGVDGIADPLFLQRFREGSALEAHDDEPSDAAQIERRARQDVELLDELMRAAGYYDARVRPRIGAEADTILVTLDVTPGPRYTIDTVALPGLDAAGPRADELRGALTLNPGDPVDADKVVAAEDKLRTTIGSQGFPFAEVGEPALVVDHDTRTATLTLDVQPGGERRFGRIITTNDRVFDGDHAQDIARFRPGQLYNAADVDDLERAIIQTGLVSSVKLTPVEGEAPGTVDLSLAMEPAPFRTIGAEIGYGTGEGARIEGNWTHRNFVKPEGALTLRGVIGTLEQVAATTLRFNNFGQRDRVLTVGIAATSLRREAFQATGFQLFSTLERQSNIFFQKPWTWSIGTELVATDERDTIVGTGEFRRRTYFVGALPASLTYDASDDLLNPTRGFRLGGRLSPEVSLSGRVFGYARLQLDASYYQPVNDNLVAAARVRIGSILGAPRDGIAPSRRYYAGGGASVRGYGFQAIGPRDPNGDPIGGLSLTEFSLEARAKVWGNFGAVAFLDGGNIYTDTSPGISDFRYGAGVGLRYYSNFGPIRIDVGTPLNPQPGDSRIAVYVSLGQAF
ncbi:autotransporter assembly complex protein TamA [Sphingomonas sp. FW199]|uniref:autotransporter assembly complex protein TamA n=1 Tax=Sphingomonas sp. FW199 TaxID=3400217 RepID=UPI003CEABA48